MVVDEARLIDQITAAVVAALESEGPQAAGPVRVPIGTSVRHVHLSQEDVETLFGRGHELRIRNELYQPGQYACEETVTLFGPRNCIRDVRVLGPPRPQTQVELARSDAIVIGIRPPVLASVEHGQGERVILAGPKGYVDAPHAAILSQRHLHGTPDDAARLGLRDGQVIEVRTGGPRAVTFSNVLVRVTEPARLELHLDTDEANAAGLLCDEQVELIL
jgi:putative phosphotransacetylase